jgi:hypothetical protein
MQKKTLKEAVDFLVYHTQAINTEVAKWDFKPEEVEKRMATTQPNTMPYHMLKMILDNAIRTTK